MTDDNIYPEVIADRYELSELLGQGGMSSVFRCVDRLLHVDCAIKLLSLEEILSRKGRERFENECQMLLHFDHPNIIHNLDYGIFDDIPYLVMELCVDEQERPFTLKQLQNQAPDGILKWDDIQNIWVQLLRGIALFHQHGLVHRDIKPENVLLQRLKDGALIPKLIDFGLVAVTADETKRARMQLSSPIEQQPIDSNVLHGTLNYMSPEQLDGNPVDASSDVFSLGIMLFNLLTGKKHPSVAPDALNQLDIPQWLKELIQNCLQNVVSERPNDASEVLEHLPDELLQAALSDDNLDRNAPTKHQLPSSANTIMLSAPINNRYQILDEISSPPGMFNFTCRDLKGGEMLAIRLMPTGSTIPEDIIDSFTEGCTNLKDLNLDGLLDVKDCGVDNDLQMAFVVTENLLEDQEKPETIAELMRSKEGSYLNWQEATRLIAPVMVTLSALHRKGITHGNVCPENIRLVHHADGSISTKLDGCMEMQLHTPEGQLIIPEFGAGKSPNTHLKEHVFSGTPDYMAPEILTGVPPSPQTDAYSLGITLYQMATGFDRPGFQVPTGVNPDLPSWVDEVCRFSLEEDPQSRVESVVLLETIVPAALRNSPFINFTDDGDATEQDQLLFGSLSTEVGARKEDVGIDDLMELDQGEELQQLPDSDSPHDDSETPEESAPIPDLDTTPDEAEVPRERPKAMDTDDEIASTLSISLDKDHIRQAVAEAGKTDQGDVARKVILKAIPIPAPEPEPVGPQEPATEGGPNMAPKKLGARRKQRRGMKRLSTRYSRHLPLIIISSGIAVSFVICFLLLDYFDVISVLPKTDVPSSEYQLYILKAKQNLRAEKYASALYNAKLAITSPGISENQSNEATKLAITIERARQSQRNTVNVAPGGLRK
ncbi:hypothetical protein BVX99_02275 [bacterium F16]|nr:hypothetical protein BVX99_02275 [bacterium F16]